MGDTILLRRGTLANLPALQAGEPGWAEDANQLYIGTGTGSAASAMPIGGYDWCPESFTQASIEATLTAIGTVNKVTLLLRPGTWVISSNADWSAYTNVTFKIVPGALLQIATGTTTQIPYIDSTGLHQRFDCVGTGKVLFHSTTVGVVTAGVGLKVSPDWWAVNANPGTTDMTNAIRSAVASIRAIGTVEFNGLYAITKPIYVGDFVSSFGAMGSFTWAGETKYWGGGLSNAGLNVIFEGHSDALYGTSGVVANYATSYPMFVILGGRGQVFKNMQIKGDGGAARASEGVFVTAGTLFTSYYDTQILGCKRAVRLGNNEHWPEDPITFTSYENPIGYPTTVGGWMVEQNVFYNSSLLGEIALSTETAQAVLTSLYTCGIGSDSATGYGIFLGSGRVSLFEPSFYGEQIADVYSPPASGTTLLKVYGGHTESTAGLFFFKARVSGESAAPTTTTLTNFNGSSIRIYGAINLLINGGQYNDIDLNNNTNTDPAAIQILTINNATINGQVGGTVSATANKIVFAATNTIFTGVGAITTPFQTFFGTQRENKIDNCKFVGPSFDAAILEMSYLGLHMSSRINEGNTHFTMSGDVSRPNVMYGELGDIVFMVDGYRKGAVEKASYTDPAKLVISPTAIDLYSATGQTAGATITPWVKMFSTTIRSGAGDPTGAVTPAFIGEEYLNTTGNHWYKAHGLAVANWTALN